MYIPSPTGLTMKHYRRDYEGKQSFVAFWKDHVIRTGNKSDQLDRESLLEFYRRYCQKFQLQPAKPADIGPHLGSVGIRSMPREGKGYVYPYLRLSKQDLLPPDEKENEVRQDSADALSVSSPDKDAKLCHQQTSPAASSDVHNSPGFQESTLSPAVPEYDGDRIGEADTSGHLMVPSSSHNYIPLIEPPPIAQNFRKTCHKEFSITGSYEEVMTSTVHHESQLRKQSTEHDNNPLPCEGDSDRQSHVPSIVSRLLGFQRDFPCITDDLEKFLDQVSDKPKTPPPRLDVFFDTLESILTETEQEVEVVFRNNVIRVRVKNVEKKK